MEWPHSCYLNRLGSAEEDKIVFMQRALVLF